MASPTPLETLPSKLRDYYTPTKPEVNLLILMTTSTGYYLASCGPSRIIGLVNTLSGTLLVASGTATLNQWTIAGSTMTGKPCFDPTDLVCDRASHYTAGIEIQILQKKNPVSLLAHAGHGLS